jgi:hypothetical protein
MSFAYSFRHFAGMVLSDFLLRAGARDGPGKQKTGKKQAEKQTAPAKSGGALPSW